MYMSMEGALCGIMRLIKPSNQASERRLTRPRQRGFAPGKPLVRAEPSVWSRRLPWLALWAWRALPSICLICEHRCPCGHTPRRHG
jgi:hypothetical protein